MIVGAGGYVGWRKYRGAPVLPTFRRAETHGQEMLGVAEHAPYVLSPLTTTNGNFGRLSDCSSSALSNSTPNWMSPNGGAAVVEDSGYVAPVAPSSTSSTRAAAADFDSGVAPLVLTSPLADSGMRPAARLVDDDEDVAPRPADANVRPAGRLRDDMD